MSSRPRRSAAQRATAAITDMADRDRDTTEQPQQQRTMSSRSSRRSGPGIASVTRGPPSSSPASSVGDGSQHMHLTVKLPSSKLRQATSSSSTQGKRKSSGSAAVAGGGGSRAGASKRARGGKKSYVIESSEEEDEEEEEEEEQEDEEEDDVEEEEADDSEKDEIEVDTRARFAKVDDDEEEEEEDDDEQLEDPGEEGAEDDEDEMDIDAEGEEDEDAEADADGDIDMDVTPAPRTPAIKITKPSKSMPTLTSKGKSAPAAKPVTKGTAIARTAAKDDDDEEDDDEELSELESEPEDVTVEVGNGEEDAEGEEEEDVDAEGEEEIEVADEDAEGEEDEELLSDEEGISRADTPDLSKLTARQRAKLGDVSHEYMKLSDEVQAKKHFTAEELSMRRAEMARRRRNLSEKRNEEVKMETINKLLKKQAPKTTRKNAALLAAGDETPDVEAQRRPDPMFIRWVNTREGSRVAVPDELLAGPAGRVFTMGGAGAGIGGGKMVEEVS